MLGVFFFNLFTTQRFSKWKHSTLAKAAFNLQSGGVLLIILIITFATTFVFAAPMIELHALLCTRLITECIVLELYHSTQIV